MDYDTGVRRRKHPVFSRVRWLCFLLSLPGILFGGILIIQGHMGLASALLLSSSLLIYLLLVASALVDSLLRPMQTLSNVVSSLREGDYSFRARGSDSRDAFGELSAEVNALADLLQKQRVHSQEATALLARILEVMHTPLFTFDRSEILQLVNDAGLKFLNISRAHCIGRTAHELGIDELLHGSDQTIHSYAGKPARWLLRKAQFRQDGVPRTLILLTDVSQPLQEEEQTAWKRLIRVLGHELSNSLTPIKSIAGSLLIRVNDLGCDDDARDDFQRGLTVIESRADALHRFVESYRRLAQLPPPKLQQVAFGALMDRVVMLERRLPVQCNSGPPVTINVDPDQLEQMLINLIANAADASLANQNQTVLACWRVDGPVLHIVIEDRGLGIANSDNLFVPFYTTKQKGSGVGLALALQIARAHGGDITLANCADGIGARATIRLPIHSIQSADASEDARDEDSQS